MIPAVHAQGHTIDLDDLDHTAACRDGDERVCFTFIAQRQPIRIRM